MIAVQVAICIAWLPRAVRGESDFRSFYVAGLQVLSHHEDRLYDAEAARLRTAEVVGLPKGMRDDPFTHPAMEALLFALFARLEYKTAAQAFLIFNTALLIPTGIWLGLLIDKQRRIDLLALMAGSLPVGFTLINGQDAIILLCLLAGSTYLLARERMFAAGVLAGLGVFRFQLVLPILILFLIWRFYRFAAGFLLSACASAVLSIATAGWEGSKAYLHMVLGMGGKAVGAYRQPIAQMPNLRGLITTLARIGGGEAHALWVSAIVLLSSIALVLWVAKRKPANPVWAMMFAIPVATLIGYHGFIWDLSILMVPITLALLGEFHLERFGLTLHLAPISAIYRPLAFIGAIPILVSTCLNLLNRQEQRASNAARVASSGSGNMP